ncbi:MAG TPA: GTP cyclohydrolase FolE2 [Candidatus Ozemobacteraceae bacterium]
MEDIQNQKDLRDIPIDRVGIKRLSYPITVHDRQNRAQQTVAEIEMTVDLPRHFRGTHMSRFIEILDAHRGEITMTTMSSILRDVRWKLSAERAVMSAAFPYFIEKTAPVSEARSLMRYDCRFLAMYDGSDDFVLTVTVPVTTLCPCSKAISRESAHNQRSMVTVSARFDAFLWIEDLVRCVEESASAEVYALLKRSDEKYLTERAYEHPRFAEDLVREVAIRLDAISAITWYTVETENFESIHAHSAYAFLKRERAGSVIGTGPAEAPQKPVRTPASRRM